MRGWVDLDEAAQRADVSRSTISRWISSGRLPFAEVLGRRYVKLRDLLTVERERHLSRGRPGPRLRVRDS
ncbi:helix-turn-helix domain-containing protein [Sphaerimonospora mesophila]|uniref:helix-turn-helix domain-containing protein n=1 Tax=Sphaerimonospora mesophila TaxID=37483 RepID=UPI0006E2C49A